MLVYLIIALCLILGMLILIGIFDVKERKRRKNEPEAHDWDSAEDCDIQDDIAELNEVGAQLIDQRCGVGVYGMRNVNVKEHYCVAFLTDDGRTLEFFVPEEIYLALDKGQKGILITTAKGAFYGFEVRD